MDLGEHLRVIWRRKWRVLGLALLVGGLVYARSSTLPEVFAADTLLSVTSGRATAGEAGSQDDTLFIAATFAQLATTDPLVADAVTRSGLDIEVAEAESRLSVAASGEVGFLTVAAEGPEPADAVALADAAAAALVDAVQAQQVAALERDLALLDPQIAEVEEQLAGLAADDPQRAALEARYSALIGERTNRQLRPIDRVEVLQPATEPEAPVAPTPRRDAALAFIVAFVLNAELWVLLEALSDRFSPENAHDEVQRATGLPILAEVPRGEGPATIEAFRTLRTNLMFLNSREQVRTLAVVGIEPGCGKSHSAIGLAQAASDLELPVMLIDADLRRPVVHQRLGIEVRPGLGDLRSREDLDRVARPTAGHPFLRVIPAGSKVGDPAGLLGGGFSHVLTLISAADLIVVDTPAAGLFAEATAIAAQCDATVIVVDARTSRRRALVRLVESLRRVGADPVGIVLNRADAQPATAYYYDRPPARASSP